jgi:hypothetical protein
VISVLQKRGVKFATLNKLDLLSNINILEHYLVMCTDLGVYVRMLPQIVFILTLGYIHFPVLDWTLKCCLKPVLLSPKTVFCSLWVTFYNLLLVVNLFIITSTPFFIWWVLHKQWLAHNRPSPSEIIIGIQHSWYSFSWWFTICEHLAETYIITCFGSTVSETEDYCSLHFKAGIIFSNSSSNIILCLKFQFINHVPNLI